MDKRFNLDIFFEEELLEGKFIFIQEETTTQKENSILVQEENEPILSFDEIANEKNSIMNASSYMTFILEFTLLDP